MTEETLDRLVEGLAVVGIALLAVGWVVFVVVFVRWLAGWFT